MRLDAVLERLGDGVALAYSGGVDSAFLKWRLKTRGVRFACLRLDVPMLSVPAVAANAPDRCYHCKSAIFSALADFARSHGLRHLTDGTNADDRTEYRPGLRALREWHVVSPLAEAGLGKADIRSLARAADLPFADDPATPCLATRFPYGTRLTPDLLTRVASAESFIAARLPHGTDVRVRVDADGAHIAVSEAALPLARRQWDDWTAECRRLGFASIAASPVAYRCGCYDPH